MNGAISGTVKQTREIRKRTDFLDETRGTLASYWRFLAFTSLPGVRLWLFSSFLIIFLVSISTGPSSVPYCPIELVSTSNWTMPSAFLTFTVYLAIQRYVA